VVGGILGERAATGVEGIKKIFEMNEMGKSRIKGEGRRQLKAWMGGAQMRGKDWGKGQRQEEE
jgi:hypothetical protein